MDGSLQAGPNHLSAERDAFIAPHLQKDLERFGTSWGEVCGGVWHYLIISVRPLVDLADLLSISLKSLGVGGCGVGNRQTSSMGLQSLMQLTWPNCH